MYSIAWLILLFPLLGFLVLSWFGSRLPKTWVGWGGSGTIGAAFGVVLLIFASMAGGEGDPGGSVEVLYHWIESETFKLDLAILVDRLSIFMLLVVTGVGFVIHVYSIGYMHHDPEYARFFSYMNLFIFSMSVLVLAADFFFLIVGWALVGLASYLLIGFWTEKRSAVLAARKAFVMNVIGDVGMVIAALMIFERFGSLTYTEVFAQTQSGFIPNEGTILMITLLLLVGAFAKSAQLPLQDRKSVV